MIPAVDLLLGTIERALAVAVLPNAENASAKEEASLGILFTRWIRDVVDHVGDAEQASNADCRQALADAANRPGTAAIGPEGASLVREARSLLDAAVPETAARRRDETRTIKALLAGMLRALRAAGDDERAREIRAALYDLGMREIGRERAFGRATGLDPDSPSLPSLADLAKKTKQGREPS